jgi:hypothetical protein
LLLHACTWPRPTKKYLLFCAKDDSGYNNLVNLGYVHTWSNKSWFWSCLLDIMKPFGKHFWHKTTSVFWLILVVCRHGATRVGYGRVWARNKKAQLGYNKGWSWSCVGTKQQSLVELHVFLVCLGHAQAWNKCFFGLF